MIFLYLLSFSIRPGPTLGVSDDLDTNGKIETSYRMVGELRSLREYDVIQGIAI